VATDERSSEEDRSRFSAAPFSFFPHREIPLIFKAVLLFYDRETRPSTGPFFFPNERGRPALASCFTKPCELGYLSLLFLTLSIGPALLSMMRLAGVFFFGILLFPPLRTPASVYGLSSSFSSQTISPLLFGFSPRVAFCHAAHSRGVPQPLPAAVLNHRFFPKAYPPHTHLSSEPTSASFFAQSFLSRSVQDLKDSPKTSTAPFSPRFSRHDISQIGPSFIDTSRLTPF